MEGQPKILAVDDDVRNLKLLAALLEPEGYLITKAHNGQEALERVQQEPPDLVLLDVMMPGMDGFQVCRAIKGDPQTSAIPVLMVTALTDLEDRVMGLEAGADDFLSRPVNKVELKARVRSLVQLKQLHDRLKREETLRFLGEMAAAAAHEIRNPLTAIRGFTQLLQSSCQDKERAYTRVIIEELDRIDGIVRRMLLLTRPKAPNLKPGDLRQVLEEAILLGQRLSPVPHRVEIEIPTPLPDVPVDAAQIKQVFLNLIINAFEAMPQGGTLRVAAEPRPAEKALLIAFTDEGEGIPAEVVNRIFEPFFTTKDHGTGLGLAVCHQIVRQHDGSIQVESTPGSGTTFALSLPLTEGA